MSGAVNEGGGVVTSVIWSLLIRVHQTEWFVSLMRNVYLNVVFIYFLLRQHFVSNIIYLAKQLLLNQA